MKDGPWLQPYDPIVFLSTDGHLLNAVTFGTQGPSFVAHGGWVGNWELWQEPFRLMHPRWRCVGYDHRGSGASTAPPSAITAQALVNDLFAVLDHLDIGSCVLAGESLGALTCLEAVLRQPDRFTGLVLLDGLPAARPDAVGPLAAGARSDYPATVRWFVDACIPEQDSEHLRRWGRQILLRAEPEAAARILEAYVEVPRPPDLTRVSVPTLVLHGERDAIVPVAVAEQVARALSHGRLRVLPGAGHVPSLTRPELVVAEIEQWAREELNLL